MILRTVLVVLIAALAGCTSQVGELESTSGVVPASELSDTAGIQFRNIDAINALRASRGLGQLDYSQALNSAALTHARDMALQQRAWHFGSDRSNPQSRATQAGFGGRILGENIAEAFDRDIEILQYWLDRPDAAALMLHPAAQSMGFGWFQEPTGKIWWVQVFGAPGRVGQSR